jgi:hypothetical protein
MPKRQADNEDLNKKRMRRDLDRIAVIATEGKLEVGKFVKANEVQWMLFRETPTCKSWEIDKRYSNSNVSPTTVRAEEIFNPVAGLSEQTVWKVINHRECKNLTSLEVLKMLAKYVDVKLYARIQRKLEDDYFAERVAIDLTQSDKSDDELPMPFDPWRDNPLEDQVISESTLKYPEAKSPKAPECVVCFGDAEVCCGECTHFFCKDCLCAYFHQSPATVAATQCSALTKTPCQGDLPVHEVKSKLKKQWMQQYDNDVALSALNDCIAVSCPQCKLTSFVSFKLLEEFEPECVCECKAIICLNCFGLGHRGQTCEEVQVLAKNQLLLKELPNPQDYLICAHCSLIGQKQLGYCNKSECPHCKNFTCAVCKKPLGVKGEPKTGQSKHTLLYERENPYTLPVYQHFHSCKANCKADHTKCCLLFDAR